MQASGSDSILVPRASPLALETLRDMATVSALMRSMQEAVRPAAEFGFPIDQAELSTTLQEGLANLNYRVAALQNVMNSSTWGSRLAGPPAPRESLQSLKMQVQRLQRETESSQQLLLILEEQQGGSVERTREVFQMMDFNGDGFISEEEFVSGATQLLNLNSEKNAPLRAEVSARFRSGIDRPTDGAGVMDFERFCAFLGSLQEDAIGPLFRSYAEGLRQLLDVSLQLTALTLARELVAPDLSPERAIGELSEYVDLWTSLQGRCSASLAAGAPADEVLPLLEEVSALAAALSLPSCGSDVGCTVESNARRAIRIAMTALGKMRSSLAFCGRGLSIVGRDLWEVAVLGTGWVQGAKLGATDREFVARTLRDLLLLVPYTIIMVVPLTPPGHVFAFSLLNRCFPGAVPSAFTERRQGVYEIYSRIAADANKKLRRPFSPVRALKRASVVLRRWLVSGKAAVLSLNATAMLSLNKNATAAFVLPSAVVS